MSEFSKADPNPDGTRGAEQWLTTMSEGVSIIRNNLIDSVTLAEMADEDIPRSLALAAKEARRLLSDIYRFGEEVHGITEDEIDSVGPL